VDVAPNNDPIAKYDGMTLSLAESAPVVLAIDRRWRAGDASALVELVAHAVTVLNVELTEVTDAMEAIAIAQLVVDAERRASS
jgi:hypothetical protein